MYSTVQYCCAVFFTVFGIYLEKDLEKDESRPEMFEDSGVRGAALLFFYGEDAKTFS